MRGSRSRSIRKRDEGVAKESTTMTRPCARSGGRKVY
jgi:hypothetical protein